MYATTGIFCKRRSHATDALREAAQPIGLYARVATQSAFGISAPSNDVRIVVGSSACQPPAFGLNLSAPIQYALEVVKAPGGTAEAVPSTNPSTSSSER